MSDSFPSVGLKFDLTEVARGQAALSALVGAYGEVSAAAQAAGQATGQAAAGAAAATKSANAESVASTKATKAAEVAEERRAQELIEQMRYDRSVIERRLQQQNLEANAAALAAQIEEERAAQALIEQMMFDRVEQDRRARAAEVVAAKAAADAKIAEAAKAARAEEIAAAKTEAAQARFLANLEQQAATTGRGKAGLAAYRAEQMGVSAEAAPFIKALQDAEKSVEHVGATSLKTRESLVILRESIRGDFTRMAGSATILAGAFGVLPILLNPITLGLIALTAAIVAVVVVMESASEETAKFNNMLTATANASGTTADAWQANAQKIAAATDTTLGNAKSATAALIASGRFQIDTVNDLAAASIKLGELTGQSADKVAASFEKMKSGVTDFAITFNDQYHMLTAAQVDYIRQLELQGDRERAEAVFAADIKAATQGMTVQYGFLAGALHQVAINASEAFNALMDIGKAQGPSKLLAQQQQELDDLRNPKSHDQSSPDIQALIKQHESAIGVLQQAVDVQNKAAEAQRNHNLAQQEGIEASARLNNEWKSLGGTADLAQLKINQFESDIAKALAANPKDTAALSMQANKAAIEARIRKQFDRNGTQTHHAAADGGSELDKMAASIESLNTQLDQASRFDLSPLADDMAKISEAGDKAYATFINSHSALERANADQAQALAMDKERLTISVHLANAYVKEGAAENLKIQQIGVSTAAIGQAHAAIDAYYMDSTAGADDYVRALGQQASAALKAANDNADLALAQKSGATSLDGISAALVKQLGLSKERADQLQEEAIKTANLTHEVNLLTAAQKSASEIADLHTAALQQINDLEKEAAAYNAGTQAVADYERQKAIAAALSGKLLPTDTGNSLTDLLNTIQNWQAAQQAADDAHRTAVAQTSVDVAKLNADITETLRLATLTTDERSVEAEVLARMVDLQRQNKDLSDAEARSQATAEALAVKRLKDAANLKIQLQDSVEQTFIDTGRIDFGGIEQGIAKAARKALYEALIQKPIDIIINAAVNFETQALSSLLGGLTGGNGGLASLFGGGTSGNTDTFIKQFEGAWGTNGSATSQLGNISSGISGLQGAITSLGGILAGGAIGASIGGSIGTALGNKKGGEIGGAIGGALALSGLAGPVGLILGGIGAVLGGLLGDHSGHATAVNFDTNGQVSGYSYSPKGSTTATIQLAQQTGVAITQLESQFNAMGIKVNDVLAGVEQGTRNDARTFLRNGQIIYTKNGDAQALSDAITRAFYQYGTYTNAQEKAVVDQLLNANATLDQISSAVQAFNQAQTDYNGVVNGLLAFTDPAAAATASVQQQQLDRRKTLKADIAAGYFSPEQIAKLAADLPALEQKEIEQALAGVATAAGGAAHSLADFKAAQKKVIDFVNGLKTGALSPLSPAAQLAAEKANFSAQLTLAANGNYDAVQGISQVAQTYLTDAQKFFGSGDAYAQVFNDVTDALTNLGNSTAVDPQVAAIDAASKALQDAINAQGLAIVTAINGASGNNNNTPAAASAIENLAGITQEQLAAIAATLGTTVAYHAQLAGGLAVAA